VRSHGAGSARQAPPGSALRAGLRLHMGRATLDVIVPRLERRDGACPKTGLVHASLTRIGPIKALGQSEPLSKADSPAITVPEPMDRMDENAERRGKHLVPLLRPTLKGKIGWAAEGIERRPAEPASQAINQPPRPSIEGMFLAVSRLRRGGKMWPLGSARPTKQHQCPDPRATIEWRNAVSDGRMKGSAQTEAHPLRT
jgi:hypothetical protein